MQRVAILKWVVIILLVQSFCGVIRITGVLPVSDILLISIAIAAESRLPSMQKKNKNEITDLLNKNIENRGGFEQEVESVKSQYINSINNKEVQKYLPESDKGVSPEAKASELGRLEQGEAENQGYKIRTKEHELLDQIQINYNDPQVRTHKRDTDRIASASEELLARLADKLKELGVDCRQKKGEVVSEPEMYIHIEQEAQKEVIYDKYLCEFLRNQYNCRDRLSVRCLDFAHQPAKFMVTDANIPYRSNPNDEYTSFEFSNRGSFVSNSRYGGGVARNDLGDKAMDAIGLGIKKSTYVTRHASETQVTIKFDINTVQEAMERLELVNVDFRTVMMLKINGRLVMVTLILQEKNAQNKERHQMIFYTGNKFL